MGGGVSVLATKNKNYSISNSRTDLGDLPEICIALILSHLQASEICKLACVNRAFRRAASSNIVWEPKLPENHQILVKKLLINECSANFLNKKLIYSRFTRPIRISGNIKEIWMDKNSGGICVGISWKGMKITGIDDRRHWSHILTDESRFHSIAYLQQIWWLEVEGNLEFEFPAGTYTLFFRLQLGTPSRRLNGSRTISNADKKVHGWKIKPVRFQLTASTNQHAESQCFLDEQGKWIHYHVGDFVVENSKTPTKIKFSMAQIDCTHPKGGLCLDSVFVFPKGFHPKEV